MRYVSSSSNECKSTTTKTQCQVARDLYFPPITVPDKVARAGNDLASEIKRCRKHILVPAFYYIWSLVSTAVKSYERFQKVITEKRHLYLVEMFKAYPTKHNFYRSERLASGRPPKSPFMDIAIAIEMDLNRRYCRTGIPLRRLILKALEIEIPYVEYEFDSYKYQRYRILKRCKDAWKQLSDLHENEMTLQAQLPSDELLKADIAKSLGALRSIAIANAYQVQADYPMTATAVIANMD